MIYDKTKKGKARIENASDRSIREGATAYGKYKAEKLHGKKYADNDRQEALVDGFRKMGQDRADDIGSKTLREAKRRKSIAYGAR